MHHATDYTTTWIAVSGAVVVALIAAVTAQVRLVQQLRHDRGLNDIDEMRRLLDEASVEANAASSALRALATAAQRAPREAGAPGSGPEVWSRTRGELRTEAENGAAYWEASDRFYEAARPIATTYQRLILRLGEDDAISKAFLELQQSYLALEINGAVRTTAAGSPERWATLTAVVERSRRAHFAWMSACRDLVGVRRLSPPWWSIKRYRKAAPPPDDPAGWYGARLAPYVVDEGDKSEGG